MYRKVILLLVILLAGEWKVGKAEQLVKISSKILEMFPIENNTIPDHLLQDREHLFQQVSTFLESIHSKRGEKEDLLLRAAQQYDESPEDNQCLQDIATWTEDKANLKLYALQMQDSWSTREGGMLEGNVRWSGHYWECVNAISEGKDFKGKFCTTYYGFVYVPAAGMVPYDITFDSCFPDSCSDAMIKNLTQLATASDIPVPALETTCSYDDKSLGGWEISCIVISSILLLLACVGTTHDIIIRIRNKETNKAHWTLCFSALKNGEKILSTKRSPSNFGSINGIRTISTLWVILYHTLILVIPDFDNTIVVGQELRKRFELMVILNGNFPVDSFFVIGGLLTSYLTLKQLQKTKGKFNVPLMYLHRYLRLTPLYLYILLFVTGLYKFLGDGPHWADYSKGIAASCDTDNIWWSNLLYVNNIYPQYVNSCVGHAWYLACDMQFYILSPLFIYCLYKWPRAGVVQSTLVLLASVAVTWWISEYSDQQPGAIGAAAYYSILSRIMPLYPAGSYQDRYKSDTYYTPWCRICVYMVGILTGYLLYKTQRKLKLPKVAVFLGWLIAVGSGLSVVYALYTATVDARYLDVHVAAFYNAVSRPVFGACVAWVIVACTCGYGGPVTTFLNWSLFLPLSRLTYAAYLIHIYVVMWQVDQLEDLVHYSAVWLTYSFCGTVVVSFCLAFLAALLIEWPCQEVLKYLLPSGRSGKAPAKTAPAAAPSIPLEKPPSYRSDDQSYVVDEVEDQYEKAGNVNLGFETCSTKI